MKKFIFICGTLLLILAIGLRAYFAFVPPPEATLEQPLAEIFPVELNGWKIQDQDMAASPESSNRISEFLKFDDALFRTYEKNSIFIGLYVAYWKPGTASYRWAGAHTPDTCWIVNGWTCSERQYAVPFTHKNTEFQPAEFGVYERRIRSKRLFLAPRRRQSHDLRPKRNPTNLWCPRRYPETRPQPTPRAIFHSAIQQPRL